MRMDREVKGQFEPVDIRSIPDDQLDDIVGGVATVTQGSMAHK
jgi:hypothetical protein